MKLWASVEILCKQRPTYKIYVRVRKMFLENSKMAHVAEISPIIPLCFALNQSNSHVLLPLFLECMASRTAPYRS